VISGENNDDAPERLVSVSQIDFFCPEFGRFESYSLNQVAKKHEFVTLKINRDVEGKLVGSLSPNVGPLSSDQWRKIVLEVNEKGLASGFVPIFFSQNSPMLSTMSHVKKCSPREWELKNSLCAREYRTI
jgi:hypothetical protein